MSTRNRADEEEKKNKKNRFRVGPQELPDEEPPPVGVNRDKKTKKGGGGGGGGGGGLSAAAAVVGGGGRAAFSGLGKGKGKKGGGDTATEREEKTQRGGAGGAEQKKTGYNDDAIITDELLHGDEMDPSVQQEFFNKQGGKTTIADGKKNKKPGGGGGRRRPDADDDDDDDDDRPSQSYLGTSDRHWQQQQQRSAGHPGAYGIRGGGERAAAAAALDDEMGTIVVGDDQHDGDDHRHHRGEGGGGGHRPLTVTATLVEDREEDGARPPPVPRRRADASSASSAMEDALREELRAQVRQEVQAELRHQMVTAEQVTITPATLASTTITTADRPIYGSSDHAEHQYSQGEKKKDDDDDDTPKGGYWGHNRNCIIKILLAVLGLVVIAGLVGAIVGLGGGGAGGGGGGGGGNPTASPTTTVGEEPTTTTATTTMSPTTVEGGGDPPMTTTTPTSPATPASSSPSSPMLPPNASPTTAPATILTFGPSFVVKIPTFSPTLTSVTPAPSASPTVAPSASPTVALSDDGLLVTGAAVAGALVINGLARLVSSDIVARNGIIHIIDTVLLPPSLSSDDDDDGNTRLRLLRRRRENSASASNKKTATTVERRLQTQSIWEIAEGDPSLSSFVNTAKFVGLPEILDAVGTDGDDGDDLTVFIPNNAAFEGFSDLARITSDADAVLRMLLYHVVPGGSRTTAELAEGTFLPTFPREDFLLLLSTPSPTWSPAPSSAPPTPPPPLLEGFLQVGGSGADPLLNFVARPTLVSAGAVTRNGVVYSLDTVLIPPSGVRRRLRLPRTRPTIEKSRRREEPQKKPTRRKIGASNTMETNAIDEKHPLRSTWRKGSSRHDEAEAEAGGEREGSSSSGAIRDGATTTTTTGSGPAETARHRKLQGGENAEFPTIWEQVDANPDMTTFANLAIWAGIDQILDDFPGPFTAFIPTNAAFESLPSASVASLTSDRELIRMVFVYHVVQGSVEVLTPGTKLETLRYSDWFLESPTVSPTFTDDSPTPIPTNPPTDGGSGGTASPLLQRGATLRGASAGTKFGNSVSISDDGAVLVVGSPQDRRAVIYRWDADIEDWEVSADFSTNSVSYGIRVAVSGDGNTVAVGSPGSDGKAYVYRRSEDPNDNADGGWSKLGQILEGDHQNDAFGWTVRLSHDGNIVAVSARKHDGERGRVKVFRYDFSLERWQSFGQTLDGIEVGEQLGRSLSLSSSGFILAISGHLYQDRGRVWTLQYNDSTQTWVSRGEMLLGSNRDDWFGTSVDLTPDASILAVGADGNDDKGDNAGKVQAYEFNDSKEVWEKLGDPLYGEAAGDQFGAGHISISPTGTHLAVGAPRHDGNSGHARVFRLNRGSFPSWTPIVLPEEIDGDEKGDHLGLTVSLTHSASTGVGLLAVGAPQIDNGKKGYARVFQLEL